MVDMECSAGIDYRLSADGGDMADSLHPDDNGFGLMADKWFDTLLTAVLPQADAGIDQTVDENTLVQLDGSLSSDPDGTLTYLWEQPSGTPVTLSSTAAVKPTFTAPEIGPGAAERLTFRLTVTDNDGFEHQDSVFVDVNNTLSAPVADAGPDQSAVAGETVTLNGSASDPDGGAIIDTLWAQVSGAPLVSIANPGSLTTSFVAPTVANSGEVLRFKLTVTDEDNLTGEAFVNVTITNVAQIIPPPPTNNGGGGGGCFIQTAGNPLNRLSQWLNSRWQ